MKSLDEAVEAVARALAFDEAEIARRKAFLEFTTEDAARLRALHAALQTLAPDFANAFYDHLLAFEETHRFIPDAASVERLKRTQAAYFDSLTAGDYGPEYISHRMRVGVVHQRIGLEPKWYFGAYNKYLGGLLPEIWQRLGKDPEAFINACRALIKIVLLDMGIATDTYIQADRQTILALREYAEMVFASIPDGLLVLSPEFAILSANRAFLKQFGLTAEAVRGRHLMAVLAAKGLKERALEVLATGIAQHDVPFSMGAAGSDARKPVRVTLTGIRLAEEEEEEEEEARLLVIVEDVTEEEALRAAALESERRFQDLVQGLDAIVWEGEASGEGLCFTFVSRRAESILGFPVERWLAEPDFWKDRVHPDDRDAVSGFCRRIIKHNGGSHGEGAAWDVEFRMQAADGRMVWFHNRARQAADSPGVRPRGVMMDITHRKQAEQALHESEQRYAALFESAPVPMYVFASDTHQFLAVNRAMIQGYGYSAQEFLAMTLFDIHEPAQHSLVRQKLADEAPQRQATWRYRRKDGSVFPAKAVAQAIEYAGRAARFVVALDVSAQAKAEQDVAEHLFTLQRAADAAQAITWHQTLKGALQEVAEQARGVIGAHQAVVSLHNGSDWAQAINTLSLSDKYAQYRDLNQPMDGSGIYALVCESNHAMRLTQTELEAHPRWRGFGHHAGTHPPMRGWLAVPLMGRDGTNIGLLQLSDKYEGEFTQPDEYVALELAQLASGAIENARLIEEVSQFNVGLEQKVAERTAALARQEAMFRALSDQAPQVVWMTKPNGTVTYANYAWFDLVGGTLDDWIGDKWLDVIHPEDLPAVKANWLAASADLSLFSGIRRMCAKDGSYHTMAYRASPVLDAQGKVLFWVGIDADITEVKAVETALRLANQELESFSYSVSHDLRSPLNTIDGFSQLLARQLGDSGNDKLRHYLARIQAGTKQMGQLIGDLLALSQVSRAQLHSELVDLSALARSIADDLRAGQGERQVALQIESSLQAQADAGLLRVVLENLLGNAWKYSSKQAAAEISFGQQLDAAGEKVFFVRDNGAGFDMAFADKLFTPFQRLHAVGEFAGTGIGLATVKRVIDRHGGRLWADAAPGRGATFFFTLPRRSALV